MLLPFIVTTLLLTSCNSFTMTPELSSLKSSNLLEQNEWIAGHRKRCAITSRGHVYFFDKNSWSPIPTQEIAKKGKFFEYVKYNPTTQFLFYSVKNVLYLNHMGKDVHIIEVKSPNEWTIEYINNITVNRKRSYCAATLSCTKEYECGGNQYSPAIVILPLQSLEEYAAATHTYKTSHTAMWLQKGKNKDLMYIKMQGPKVRFFNNDLLHIHCMPLGIWSINIETNHVTKSQCMLHWNDKAIPLLHICNQLPQISWKKLIEHMHPVYDNTLIYKTWLAKNIDGFVPDINSTIASKLPRLCFYETNGQYQLDWKAIPQEASDFLMKAPGKPLNNKNPRLYTIGDIALGNIVGGIVGGSLAALGMHTLDIKDTNTWMGGISAGFAVGAYAGYNMTKR